MTAHQSLIRLEQNVVAGFSPRSRRARTRAEARDYFTVQGVGFHPALFGSFLKSVVLINGRLK